MSNKDRMITLLNSFVQRLEKLEGSVLPLYEHTGMLQKQQQSKTPRNRKIAYIQLVQYLILAIATKLRRNQLYLNRSRYELRTSKLPCL